MAEAPQDNIFGKILRGELPSTEVYSNNRVYCFLDLYPQNPGHTLVVPRNYSTCIVEMAEVDIAVCMAAIRKLVPAITKATGNKGITVISNIGKDAGQMVEYVHFHIIPRYPGDKVSLQVLGPEQTPEQLAEMAEKIKAHM